ncbi:MAG: hypothetical protein ACI83P_002643, partial [Janthinobacterium sp.]
KNAMDAPIATAAMARPPGGAVSATVRVVMVR